MFGPAIKEHLTRVVQEKDQHRNEPYGMTLNFMEFAMLPPDKEKQV